MPKRRFLNTSKAKKAVEDVYAPKASQAPALDSARKQKQPAPEPDRGGNVPPVAPRDEGVSKGEPVDDPMSDVKEPSAPKANMSTSPSADRKGKGKGKGKRKENENVNTPHEIPGKDFIELPTRPPPGRPGWGYRPEEEELHRVPPHYGLEKRAVFCRWPHNPKGKSIIASSEKSRGKLTPDGFPWGATLYDFLYVSRFPGIPGMASIMTSSQILHAMKGLGELRVTDEADKWIESEPDPRDESLPMGGELLECRETRIKMGVYNQFSARDDTRNAPKQGIFGILDLGDPNAQPGSENRDSAEEDEDEDDEDGMEVDEKGEGEGEEIAEEDQKMTEESGAARNATATANEVSSIPTTSPFHPSHYPSPWPMIPFSVNFADYLQDRIPLYLLPQTLHVHDPFDLLPAAEVTEKDTSWTSKPDVIRTYRLNLTGTALKGVKEARESAKAVEEFKARTLIIMRFARTQKQMDNFEPVIEVPLPPHPKRPTTIEESHLYISPAAKVGTGHHSVVYNAEWELPRDLFLKPKICVECFEKALEKEKKRLKDTGRWDKMLKAAGWGPKGFTGVTTTMDDLDAVNDPPTFLDDEIIEREVTCVVPFGTTPMQVVEMLANEGCWDYFLREKGRQTFLIQLTEDEVYPDTFPKYHPPPVLRVNPSFSYNDPSRANTECSHLVRLGTSVPRTGKFTVVAKLSLQHDAHLGEEAKNYQRFPDHFFQHWSGYTLMSQLHTIVPVRAIVPQFYGYYTPKSGQKGKKPYLSPILLIEHCGTPIDPDELSISDKEECASLLLRFQRSGWLHESVYARNILVQKGSPTMYPLKRMISDDLSFRLIDFGRSRTFTRADEKREEEMAAIRLFKGLGSTMGVTLGWN